MRIQKKVRKVARAILNTDNVSKSETRRLIRDLRTFNRKAKYEKHI